MTDGVVDGKHQIHQLLDAHFDRVLAVCKQAQMLELEPLSRLLAACASQMAENSIWTVTRAVNSRVTKFVKTLVDRGRGDRAIFDVLTSSAPNFGGERIARIESPRSSSESANLKRQDINCAIPNPAGIESV